MTLLVQSGLVFMGSLRANPGHLSQKAFKKNTCYPINESGPFASKTRYFTFLLYSGYVIIGTGGCFDSCLRGSVPTVDQSPSLLCSPPSRKCFQQESGRQSTEQL